MFKVTCRWHLSIRPTIRLSTWGKTGGETFYRLLWSALRGRRQMQGKTVSCLILSVRIRVQAQREWHRVLALYEISGFKTSSRLKPLCPPGTTQRRCMCRNRSLYQGQAFYCQGWKERSNSEPFSFTGKEEWPHVREALLHWGRADLIGKKKHHLVPPRPSIWGLEAQRAPRDFGGWA